DDERTLAVFGVDQRGAATRIMAREIQGADQARRALDEDQRLLLIPGVVAQRDGVGAGVEQLLVNGFGDAKATRRILAIDDDQFLIMPGRKSLTAVRPVLPTTSPMKRIRKPICSGNRTRLFPLAQNRAPRRVTVRG